jgi:hypothetical protein
VGFDCETVLTRDGAVQSHMPLCFQVYSLDFKKPFIRFIRVEDFKNGHAIFNNKTRSSVFVSFNAEFDFAALLKTIDRTAYTVKAIYNKSRFIRAEITRKNLHWYIYDLMNIFPLFNLKRLGEMFNVPKLEKPDFLGIDKPKNDREWQILRDYAMQDAKICYVVAKWVQNRFGILGLTLPSTCLNYFNRVYKPDYIYQCKSFREHEPYIRQAYKGGRVEAWVRGSPPQKVYVYDVVSLYPYIMCEYAFPCGNLPLKVKTTLNLDREGAAECTVLQDSEIPLLCTRLPDQHGFYKLVFPNGKFKDWFTIAELRAFEIKRLGKILTVHKVLEANDNRFYFKDYVNEFWKLKNEDVEKRDFWKLCLNALYGKFGFNGKGEQLLFAPTQMIKQPLPESENPLRFPRNVLLASYVTAYARIYMHKLYSMVGAENIAYTDTDSIHSFKPLNFTGENLGDLSFKGEGKATYIRAKFYLLNDYVKCRGLPKIFSANDLRNMIKKGTVKTATRKLERLRNAYRRHLPFLCEVLECKNFSLEEDGKRVYHKHLNNVELLEDYSTSTAVMLNGQTERVSR